MAGTFKKIIDALNKPIGEGNSEKKLEKNKKTFKEFILESLKLFLLSDPYKVNFRIPKRFICEFIF